MFYTMNGSGMTPEMMSSPGVTMPSTGHPVWVATPGPGQVAQAAAPNHQGTPPVVWIPMTDASGRTTLTPMYVMMGPAPTDRMPPPMMSTEAPANAFLSSPQLGSLAYPVVSGAGLHGVSASHDPLGRATYTVGGMPAMQAPQPRPATMNGAALQSLVTALSSKVEAYLLENVGEGSMRSLSVSVEMKQREPDLSRAVLAHFEDSWPRFIQQCSTLDTFYYRQAEIERHGLQGYAEEHEARLRVARFPKHACEERDRAIVRHREHSAELATARALLLIRDSASGVIELCRLRSMLSERMPSFFKDMTRSMFKRLLTRVAHTPVWISGNYIKLRRSFTLVPWARTMTFEGHEADPMGFVHQMVMRIGTDTADDEEGGDCTVVADAQHAFRPAPEAPVRPEPVSRPLAVPSKMCGPEGANAIGSEMAFTPKDVAIAWTSCGEPWSLLNTRAANASMASGISLD